MVGIQRRGLEMVTFAPEEMLFFHSETHSNLSIKEEYLYTGLQQCDFLSQDILQSPGEEHLHCHHVD